MQAVRVPPLPQRGRRRGWAHRGRHRQGAPHGPGTLDLPGGFVDPDESAEDALIREIEEELNLKARRCSFTYLGSFPNAYPYGGITYLTLDLAFACSVESFAPQKFSEEIAGVKLFRPSEIPLEQVGFSSIRSILQEYRKTKQR